MHSFRSRLPLLAAFFLIVAFTHSSHVSSTSAGPLAAQVVEAYFSPPGGAIGAIVREIGNPNAIGRR
jgi:hypothetical protein